MRSIQTKYGIWTGRFIVVAILVLAMTAVSTAQESTDTKSLPEAIHWKQYIFSIPYRVHRDAKAPDAPVEVRLFVSSDRGVTWNEVSRVPANIKGFTYYATEDGEYWFALQTIDRRGALWPPGPHQVGLRVIVDTESPRIQLNASTTPSGEVEVLWQVTDDHLMPSSLQIEVKTDADPAWHPVALVTPVISKRKQEQEKDLATVSDTIQENGLHDGRAIWEPPDLAGTAIVRATITDRAGNQTETSATVLLANRGERVAMLPRSSTSLGESQGILSPPGRIAPVSQPLHDSPENVSDTEEYQTLDQPPPTGSNRSYPPTQDYSQQNPPDSLDGNRTEPWPVDATAQIPPDNIYTRTLVGKTASPALQKPDSTEPEWQTLPPTGRAVEAIPSDSKGMASSANPLPPGLDTPVHLPPIQPDRPSLRLVNARSFALEYEVESVGPWGVGRVELWGTTDGGTTWRHFGDDPDLRSPMTVTVDGEGEYGFRILIQSAGSINAAPPRPNETPDVWIRVDLKTPTVMIDAVRKGQGNLEDHLTIRWTAADEQLAEHPIALFYASHPAGPWSTIATQLENTGQYMWRLPQHVPDQLFIRVEARDKAGNAGIYGTANPVIIQRPQPMGRIRGVRTSD